MESWLRGLHLEQYAVKLCAAGFISLEDCSRITEPDLINLDILPGHRKRILMNIPVPAPAPKDESDDDAVYENVVHRRESERSSGSDVYVPPDNGFMTYGINYDIPTPLTKQVVSDDVYDVPKPLPRKNTSLSKMEEESDDEDYYVNVHDLNLTKKSQEPSPPPILPPKMNSVKRQSVDEMLGMVPTVDSTGKRPVPAPRKTVKSGGIKNMPLGMSVDSALSEMQQPDQGTPSPKPTPKPRLRKNVSVSSVAAASKDSHDTSSLSLEASSVSLEVNEDVESAIGVLDEVLESVEEKEPQEEENTGVSQEDYEVPLPHPPLTKVLSPDEGISSGFEDDIYEPFETPTGMDQPAIRYDPGAGHIDEDSTRKPLTNKDSVPPEKEGSNLHVTSSLSEPGYHPVWVSSSGMSFDGVKPPAEEPKEDKKEPEVNGNLAGPDKPKLQLKLPENTKPFPGVISPDNVLLNQFSPDSRQSIISFCQPPPSFTPPPLPPGVQPIDFTQSPTAKPAPGPPMMKPLSRPSSASPPVIPPRPKNYLPKAESPKTEEPVTKPRSNSSGSLHPKSPRTVVSAIPEEEIPPNPAPVLYDTPADANGPLVYTQTSNSNEYSELSTFKGGSHSRTSTGSFTDLASQRAEMTSPAKGACAHPFPPEPEKSHQPPTPERSAPQHYEENIYVDEPIRRSSPSMPPVPPPRGPKPFPNLCEPTTGEYDSSLAQQSKNFAELESDDTLSDGGEFLESELRHLRPSVLQTSIPIVPATPNSIKERRGYLYKLPSRRSQKRVGWRKRWVTFDGEELMYFSDEKSIISKRIIPLNTIVNVEQQIKGGSSVLKRVSEMGDMHPYEFRLTTIDRVYRFAADDGDDLALWTSILMRAIIDSKPEKFEEGGSMARPDREGFVRMEGLKGRQYLVIKKDKFCYYNTFSDYKVGTPIHRVDLQLASVKDAGKGKLLLTTPRVSFGLICESDSELASWKEAFEEGIAEGLGDDTVLKEVYENHSNRYCADCGAPDPHWASVNLGITVCKQCAGIHRMISIPLSKVRSLRMDFRVWTPTLIQMLKKIGNDNSNNFWEWNATDNDQIDSDADMSSRQDYVLSKYREKRFCRLHPLKADVQALNEALCKSVQYGDVLETLQVLFSGADILCTSSAYGGQHESPLQLARKAKQTLQTEFLYQNGAEGSGQWPVSQPISGVAAGASSHLQSVMMKGHLFKLQSNQKEYNRRWFVLERGILSYFDNDKSTVAKESVERKEIMSVAATSDDKFEYGFEISTTKAGGRNFTMASDTEEERHQWIVKIAKSFAPLPTEALDQIKDLDRGGLIFLREGATTDWQTTWMHLKKKNLYIYKKDEQKFDEIDLRKVTGVSKFTQCSTQTLQRTDLCLESFDDGPPFVIDLPNRALYIQGDTRAETESWCKLVEKVSTEGSNYLVDMQLTADNVPVIVDKSVNFISAHGMRMEGLYRLNGQHSKVGLLLEEFKTNAQNVFLSLDLYQVHDVATALKRLFRTLEEPLLTSALFNKWIETSNMHENGPKMQWYKYLLGELPTVHYATLKRLMIHLARVSSFEIENKMSETNLAAIFGPILMKVDKDTSTTSSGYGSTTQEISVILDLIANHKWLFEIKDDELEHERKIQEAVEKIERASRENQKMRESLINTTGNVIEQQAGDLLIGIYVNSREGDVITLKVPATMTTQEVLQFVESKAGLDPTIHWGIYEVICQNQLERPLHYLERVLDVNLRWSEWSEDYSRDNYLVVKPNVVIDKVKLVFDPHFSLFNEFKFSDKKGFKKYYFEFSKYKLSYQKDTRATNPIASWNIEELILYTGIEQKRGPPTKWGLTFISNTEKVVKSKDTPYFGHSISCVSEEEMYRWLAAMLHAQHPGGLVPEGMKLNQAVMNDPPLPIAVEDSARADPSRPTKKSSFFQKFSRR